MKYTIEGFSQQGLLNLKFDTTDAVLLRWIVDFKSTDKMKTMIVDGEEYFWINYQAVIEEIPIIGIKNKESLGRRLKKISETGLLKFNLQKKSTGTFTYYRFDSDILSELFSSSPTRSKSRTGSIQKSGGSGIPTRSKSRTKDSSIIDLSIKEEYATPSEKDLSSTKKPGVSSSKPTLNPTPFLQEDEDGFRSRVELKKVKTVDDWTAVDFRWHLKRKHEAAYGGGTAFEYAKKSRADGQIISKIKRTLIDKFLDTGLTKTDLINYIDWAFGSDDGTVKGKCTRMKEGIVITLSFLASNNLIAEWMSGKNNGNGKSKYTEEQKQAVADMVRARTIN